ncbi:MAG: hypothetical protein L0215_10530 [Gemmataceae bacterium]|nr:hypothetical protein [Gemmataceae bacterium]
MDVLQRIQKLSGHDRQHLREQLDRARQEQEEWRGFGTQQFARAYGPDEPEYTEADIKHRDQA